MTAGTIETIRSSWITPQELFGTDATTVENHCVNCRNYKEVAGQWRCTDGVVSQYTETVFCPDPTFGCTRFARRSFLSPMEW